MNLFGATLAITTVIIICIILPFVSKHVKDYSTHLFLLGTGAMIGLCLFDLIPDLFSMGGYTSIYVIIFISIIYYVIHSFHICHHEYNSSLGSSAFLFLIGSLVAHNFASGMLLTISYDFSKNIATTVFLALLAHKGYEALMLSSIVLKEATSNLKKNIFLLSYISAFPAGVLLTFLLHENFSERLAIIISSVAVGTLISCLIFDFLVPSIKYLKHKRLHVLWLIAGFFLTQIIDFYNFS
jgi:zinc transporter ZupT